MLSSYFGGPFNAWKNMLAFCVTYSWASGKYTYMFRIELQDRVNICSCRCSLALGYGVDRILSCGGWSAWDQIALHSYPHQAVCRDPRLFRHTIRLVEESFLGNFLVIFPECSSFRQMSVPIVLYFRVDWVLPSFCDRC